MLTAHTGMLITAMLFAWGLSLGNRWLMFVALLAAGVAWIINVCDETGANTPVGRYTLAVMSVGLVLAGYLMAFLSVLRGAL